MTKHLMAGVAAALVMAGVALAQTYPPPTTPPEMPGSSTSTTTIAPSPNGGYRATTTKQGVDEYGNPVTRKDIYKEGVAGSSETHTTTKTGPLGDSTTTRSTTTTNPQ